MLDCTLCAHPSTAFTKDRFRSYFRCGQCDLVFVDPADHLDTKAEKARYDKHQNSDADLGYRAFLNKLAEPLKTRLQPGMHGLEYGCGPAPVLAKMLEAAGMKMSVYDPFYAPDSKALQQQYDFISCTEVVEHFRSPANEWPKLVALLKNKAWLGVMTRLLLNPERFLQWDYSNDPTHLSFYSAKTFDWVGKHYGLSVELLNHEVILIQKH